MSGKNFLPKTNRDVAKNIMSMYSKPAELDYNAMAADFNKKLKDDVIKGELYEKAFNQLDGLIEKSGKFSSFKRIGESGEYSYDLVAKK